MAQEYRLYPILQEEKSYWPALKEISYKCDMKTSDEVREFVLQKSKDAPNKGKLAEWSRLIGRSDAYLQQFITRRSPRKLGEEDRSKLAAVMGVSEYELGGPPQPTLIRPSGPEISEVTKVGEGWPDVGDEWMDVRGVTVGGDDSYFYFGDVIDQVRRPPGIRNAKNVAALNVAGESMSPRFEPGELIYVQLREPAPGDDVVVELYPEEEGDAPKSFLKRLVKKTGLRLICRQHNPASPIEFDRGEVKNLWRVLTLRDLLG